MKLVGPKVSFRRKQTVKKQPKKLPKLPSTWRLASDTTQEIVLFWRPLFGILAVYVVLFFVVTQGLALDLSVGSMRSDIQDALGGTGTMLQQGSMLFVEVLSSNSLNASDTATSLLQTTLTIMTALAIVWSLRRLRELKKVPIRDAFYKGTAAFVPFTIVFIALLLLLIPFSVAGLFLNVASQYGSRPELIVAVAVSVVTLLLTLYWYVCLWPSLFIVSLGDIRPLSALKKGRLLTKGRRLQAARKIVLFGLVMCIVFFGLLYLTAVLIPVATLAVLAALSFVVFLYTVTFFYMLYRSLL